MTLSSSQISKVSTYYQSFLRILVQEYKKNHPGFYYRLAVMYDELASWAGWLASWLGWLAGWLAGLAGWLAGWLAACLHTPREARRKKLSSGCC